MRHKIIEAGVSKDKILLLPSIDDEDSVLEDYVPADSYLASVNQELSRSGCDRVLSEEDISRPNRPKKLERWCKENSVSTPSKRVVAYHLVENQYDNSLVDEAVVPLLSKLMKDINSALGIKSMISHAYLLNVGFETFQELNEKAKVIRKWSRRFHSHTRAPCGAARTLTIWAR